MASKPVSKKQTKEPKAEGMSRKSEKPSSENGVSLRPLIIILQVVVIVVGVVFGFPYLAGLFGKHKEVATNVDHLTQRIITLEAREKALEKILKNTEVAQLKELKDSLENLQQRLTRFENPQLQKDLSSQIPPESLEAVRSDFINHIRSLEERLVTLETAHTKRQEQLKRWPGIVRAFTDLKRVTQTSSPFEPELQRIIQLLPQEAPVKEKVALLQQAALHGVLTLNQLQAEFSDQTIALLRQIQNDIQKEKQYPWWKQGWNYLRNLVVIRKPGGTGKIAETNTQLVAIEKALERGNIGEALTHVSQLSPQAQTYLSPWIMQAKMRWAIEKNIPELEAYALIQGLITPTEDPTKGQN